MEIQYYGANCLRLLTKKANITIDDNISDLGLKTATKPGDIVLNTFAIKSDDSSKPKIVLEIPGEYEVSNTSIKGIAARGHMDEEGIKSATIFKIIADELRIAVVGHIYPELSDEQLEALGTVDILIVPVGGNGYTLDGIGALNIIRKIEPKLVIPTHYFDKAISYEVPQQPLEEALKGLSMEMPEVTQKLKIKSGDLSETMQLAVIERQ